MTKQIEIRALKRATLEGDQWEPIVNEETGALRGFHAIGTNCTIYITQGEIDYRGELFKVPDHGRVLLQDGLVVLPESAEPGEVVLVANDQGN